MGDFKKIHKCTKAMPHSPYQLSVYYHTANKGPVRIQYKCLVSHLCILKNETVQPPLSKNRIIMFCLPIPTLIYLWEIYILPGSVRLFCCSQICGPILGIYKSLTDTWMCKIGILFDWDWGRTIPRKGIHRWDFRCSALYKQLLYLLYVLFRSSCPLGQLQ